MTSASTDRNSGTRPIRIDVRCQAGKSYRSIDNLVWDDIPPFAVITGPNGSGKTQLLEVIAYKLTGTFHPELGRLDGVEVNTSPESYGPGDVAFIPSRWEPAGASHVGIAQLLSTKEQLLQDLQHNHGSSDIKAVSRRARLRALVGPGGTIRDTFFERLSDDFAFMLEDDDVVSGLAYVFVAYRLRRAEALERGVAMEAIGDHLGPAPWDVINDALREAELAYEVVPPTQTPISDNYKLELKSSVAGQRIEPGHLSSGEKMLLAMVLWLYKSEHHGRFPRLFLMDEPDCHLHPAMARQFLNVIEQVLVRKYGVRVILTTHSPTTVALAPEGSLFEMSREHPRIQRSKSRASTVGLLTAGLVVVSEGTRLVLVEDQADVEFYGVVRDVLSDYGPSRDSRSMKPAPSLIFLPASTGSGPGKTGGGRSVVEAWVKKFDQQPLNELVRGVIDRDESNVATSRIQVLGRYSIENYLLDPFVVYCLLSSAGSAPKVSGTALSSGDEHRIREMSNADLGAILSTIAREVMPYLAEVTPNEKETREVVFTNGRRVQYPAWMLDRRGHDLLVPFQSSFGGAKAINPPKLLESFRRLRLVPTELADIMENLQSTP